MEKIKTFKEWLELKEGLWLNDSNSEPNGTAVNDDRKSGWMKAKAGGGMAAAGGFGNMALGGRR